MALTSCCSHACNAQQGCGQWGCSGCREYPARILSPAEQPHLVICMSIRTLKTGCSSVRAPGPAGVPYGCRSSRLRRMKRGRGCCSEGLSSANPSRASSASACSKLQLDSTACRTCCCWRVMALQMMQLCILCVRSTRITESLPVNCLQPAPPSCSAAPSCVKADRHGLLHQLLLLLMLLQLDEHFKRVAK